MLNWSGNKYFTCLRRFDEMFVFSKCPEKFMVAELDVCELNNENGIGGLFSVEFDKKLVYIALP